MRGNLFFSSWSIAHEMTICVVTWIANKSMMFNGSEALVHVDTLVIRLWKVFRKTLFLTEERLNIYFTGLTLGTHDGLDVKTSKLPFRTKDWWRKSGEGTVYPVSGECKRYVWTEKQGKREGIKCNKEKWEGSGAVVFHQDESYLLVHCLKIVNLGFIDIYHFALGFAFTNTCNLSR